MKEQLKNLLKDVRTYLILGLIIVGGVYCRSCNQKVELGQLPNINYKLPDKVYTDEKGVQHAQQTTQPTTTDVLASLVDSLISENKNLKNAQSLVQVSTRIDTVFVEKIKWKDSTAGDFVIQKKDDYINLLIEGNIKSNDSKISLEINDTISVVTTAKKHLFKPDETSIDISMKNPYNKVQQMRSYSVPEKKSLLVIGPSAGILWDGSKWRPSVGVAVTYNLFSIKTRK